MGLKFVANNVAIVIIMMANDVFNEEMCPGSHVMERCTGSWEINIYASQFCYVLFVCFVFIFVIRWFTRIT